LFENLAAPPPGPERAVARRLLWLLGGVAVMAGVGYLVAAVVLFPAPLLPNERVVPQLLGSPHAAADSDLSRSDLTGEVVNRVPHPTAPAGSVIWQDPPPGVAVPHGTKVSLTLSTGMPRVAVPEVRGLDADLAQRLLWAAGLGVEQVDTVPGTQQPAGVAMGTTPPAGAGVILGGTVVLHLARGKR
jgi:beta-lactam-binding protein with PASTA domain